VEIRCSLSTLRASTSQPRLVHHREPRFTSSVRSPGFLYQVKINKSGCDSSEYLHCLFLWNEQGDPSSCGNGGHHLHRMRVISPQLMCTTRNGELKLTEQTNILIKRKA
jgi:hypothetical protein